MNSPSLHPLLQFIMDDARALATPAETARLLNVDEQDDSAFAEVILDYFYDRETAQDLSLLLRGR